MGLWSRITDALGLNIADSLNMVEDQARAPRFSVDIPVGFGGLDGSNATSLEPIMRRIPRRLAMTVPAVRRGRNLICPQIAGLPLRTYNAARVDVTTELLVQPERDVARSITMTRLIEDLMFEQVAWWRVTETIGPAPYDYPLHVKRLRPCDVDCSTPGEVWWTDPDTGKRIQLGDRELIKFESPTDGILTSGAGAIATVIMLDRRAHRSAENPTPDGYFTPKDGVDPFDDEDPEATEEERALLYTAKDFLAEWRAARAQGTQGWVPGGVDYEQLQWDPKAMQLAEARQHAVLEIARLMDLEPEDVGVSTTSRTYFNAETKRRERIDSTLGMYMRAVEDRLSMGDVTPRGQYTRFQVAAFVGIDTAAKLANYRSARELGLQTLNQQRALEDQPPIEGGDTFALTPAAEESEPATPEEPNVNDNVRQLPAAAARAGVQFADGGLLTMTATSDQQFRVDTAKRQISGIAVPYGEARAFHAGQTFAFSKGSIRIPEDPSRVKLYVNHDPSTAAGHAIVLDDRDDGLYVTFQVDGSPDGDRVLQKAHDKVWDGLSAGFRQGSVFKPQGGVQFAVDALVGEISVCPNPAFEDSRVQSVALSADTEGNTPMRCNSCGQVHVHGVTACDPQAVATFAAQTNPAPAQTAPAASVTPQNAGVTTDQPITLAGVTEAIANGFTGLQNQLTAALAVPNRELVPANGPGAAQFQVREELPYRFDGSTRGEHCFTDDLRDMNSGSQEAKTRLYAFMDEWAETFAVTTGNVSAFNPVQNRPDMYVPSLQYTRPLWESVSTGTIDNISAFNIPKFGAASGLVGAHVQGTEPTPGAFSATFQQVQPSAISGKVEINREVWDLGGNPQTDTIIWNEMQNAYFEGAETRIAAMLNAIAAANLYGGAEINLAGAVDSALDTALTNLFVDLQFARGGNRYNRAVADGTFYKALAAAKDTAGRKLYPLLGPTNANGQIEPVASSLNVGGQTIRPAWALGSGNAAHSYLFVPSSVWAWLSAPKRFTFEYQVKSVDMAVWGYTAAASLRDTDIIRVDYTTADV